MSLDMSPQTPDAEFLQKKQRAVSYLAKLIKRTHKQVRKRQETLQNCQQWSEVHHLALLLQSNLYRIKKGMPAISIADWEQEGKERLIALDPLAEPNDQAAALFRQSRKLRLGLPHAEKQLQLIEEALSHQKQLLEALQEIATIKDLETFFLLNPITVPPEKGTPQAKESAPLKPYRTYISESGLPIWVGKSAKNNDTLTFHYAKGLDWWMHAHDYPGSHVVLSCQKGHDPDPEAIRDAAELAWRFSQARGLPEGEVTVTQVKYLNRIKGCPGKVQVSKHKVMYVRLDPIRWSRLTKKMS